MRMDLRRVLSNAREKKQKEKGIEEGSRAVHGKGSRRPLTESYNSDSKGVRKKMRTERKGWGV